jgi:hypothetical protein
MVYVCGFNEGGELGNGGKQVFLNIERQEFLKYKKIIDLTTGLNHSLTLTEFIFYFFNFKKF